MTDENPIPDDSGEKARGAEAERQAKKPKGAVRGIIKPNPQGIEKLTCRALSSLYRIMTDEGLKPSDRLNAIKTALDYASKLPEEKCENAVTVVFENIPKEYAE